MTDTCIPEDTAIRRIEEHMLALWRKADRAGESYFPYQFFYQLLESGAIRNDYEIDLADSWMVAAQAKGSADLDAWLGRLHAGEYFYQPFDQGNSQSSQCCSEWG